MSQMENARPGAGSGTGAKMAGETTGRKTTHPSRMIAIGRHRRHCRAFDRWALDFYGDEACARYGITPTARNPEPYAAGGMTLDVAARERAA